MQMIQALTVRSSAAMRVAAIAFLAGAATLSLHAQNVARTDAADSNVTLASVTPTVDLANLNLSSSSSYISTVGIGESSSAENYMPAVSDPDDAAASSDELQPPPRRRYGRPRYNDSMHNADGSNKFAFMAGGGASIPVGNFHEYDTPSWGFQVGGGRNFNKKFSVLLQFDYNQFGLQGRTIANRIYVDCPTSLQTDGVCTQATDLDGNSHIWSFTLDPKYNFYEGDKYGAYVVAGGGFYHKVTNFTLPENFEECYYYCYDVTANENVDHYTSNAFGVNAGFGMTYKLSKSANERLYIEGRYVYMLNSQRYGYTAANVLTTLYQGYNAYPENSNRTAYIPITVGLRF